jgi:NADH-quinone oxidoreductase subunit E
VPDQITKILSRHTGQKDELIPILQEVQEEFGFLSSDAMKRVAKFLHITENTTFGVATFYAQFRFHPRGKNRITVCRGTACHVRGSPRIVTEVEKLLSIKPGEITSDMEWELETIACFGSCALAPVMVVNGNVYGRMTPARVAEIIGKKK